MIWGAGAIGGVIGAHLVRAGHSVQFVDVVPEHVQAMCATGLHITGPVADFHTRASATLPGGVSGMFATILLCVKAHHSAAAVLMLAPHLQPDGVVVSVQNGLNAPAIADVVGVERTLACFVNFGADYLEPGVIHYGGRGTIALGEVDGRITPRAHAIHDLFRAFDERAILTNNVHGFLWAKLAYASMLFATALSDEGIADALERPAHRPVYVELAREVVRVAHAEGVRLEPFDGFEPGAYHASSTGEQTAASLDALVRHNRRSAKTHSGIWRDLAVRRRRTEVDAQLGAIVAAGQRHHIETPLNTRLIAMIHEIEDRTRAQSAANLDQLGDGA